MIKPVLHLDDVELQPWPAGQSIPADAATRYSARTAPIGTRIGARKLGINVTVVPPGRSAYPAHNHHANEEMFFILSGSGVLRFGEESHDVRAGCVISCPSGDHSTAHQLINTGEEDLRYLAISTKLTPEFVEYPDSGKFGLLVELPADADGEPRRLVHVGRLSDAHPYWDGE